MALLAMSCQPKYFNVPATILWAWERPENLTFLHMPDTAVAFLAAVIIVQPDGYLVFRPRTQSLQLNPATPLIAVVRIESPARHAAVDVKALASMLHDIAAQPNVRSLQIDFDARESERVLYRQLLHRLQSSISRPVSVTALASWCAGDRWLDHEPIAEAVPMFFRMGQNESRNMPLESQVCLSAIGLSLDEVWPNHRPPEISRVYLFSPRAWTRATFLAASERLEQWK